MQEPSHVRAVSFVLALLVVFAAWFLFEDSNRPATHPFAPTKPGPPANTQPLQPALNQPRLAPGTLPSNLSITYKCERNGRISYGDKPCAATEKALAITAVERESPVPQNDLERLRKIAASMEVSRLEREKALVVATKQITASSTNQAKEFQCQQIDLAIAAKDSELRQPHSAQHGDYLTGERRKLTDERFSIGC